MKIVLKNNFRDEFFFHEILSCIERFLLIDLKINGFDPKYKDYVIRLLHNFNAVRKTFIHEPNLVLEIYPHDKIYLENINKIKTLSDYPLDISNKQYSFYIDLSDICSLSFFEFEKGLIFSRISLNKQLVSIQEIKTSMLYDIFNIKMDSYLISPIKNILNTDKEFDQISKEEFEILKLIKY